MKTTPFILLLFCALTPYAYSQAPAAFSQANCQVWEEFVKAQKKNRPTTLLDFSFAGYRHSEVSVPQVNTNVYNVCDFGAIPDDHRSDREAVIAAIAAAEANGGGVVYFPKGRFRLHQKGEPHRPITVRGSHIVLRGEGAGHHGTELLMEDPLEPINPKEMWTSPSLLCFTGGGSATMLTQVVSDAQRGTFSLKVADASELKAGYWVCLRLNNNSPEMIAKELAPYKVESDWSSLLMNGVQVNDYHQIAAVKGNTITFKAPIMHGVEVQDGWKIYSFPHIEEVGVEQIAFIGNWKEVFVHHKDWLHDGGYKWIEYRNVANAWIRACRFTDVSEAATINSSANVSIYDCVVTGHIGHNSFHSQGSSRVFMGGIDDQPSQWHSVGVAKPAIGTVIWRVLTRANSCFESHASQPRATLMDACEGGFMKGRSGGAIQNSPNHLRDLVFWNYKELDAPTTDFSFWPTDDRWFKFMPPVVVGFQGAGTTFVPTEVAYEESNGRAVEPESLFEAQLTLRLGKLPQWLVELKEQVARKQFSGQLLIPDTLTVTNPTELTQALLKVKPGDTILLEDGEYRDVQLQINASGSFTSPISIRAAHPGTVIFSGDAKVEVKGNHIELAGIYFKEGSRSSDAWQRDDLGLLTIYGDHCRVSECLFDSFDGVDSPYLSTALNGQGCVPRYSYIDRCAFLGKSGASEMIRFVSSSTSEGDSLRGMYHRVERCYFSNPKRNGEVSGAIRLGSEEKAYGRCLINDNLFEWLDTDRMLVSEAQENVFYNNTFLNCQGTLQLNGNGQAVLNNFFIGTDRKNEYGGLLVRGSNHLIGCNYFHLPRTLTTQGNAAIRFEGDVEAATRVSAVVKNLFVDVDRYALCFAPKAPQGIRFLGNQFLAEDAPHSSVMYAHDGIEQRQVWEQNFYTGIRIGIDSPLSGLEKGNSSLRYDDSKAYVEDYDAMKLSEIERQVSIPSIEGVTLDVAEILKFGCCYSPLSHHAVGPAYKRPFRWQ